MIKEFMIRHLERRGFIVLQDQCPMLLVSGAIAKCNDTKLNWTIQFSHTPSVTAINRSVIMIGCEDREICL